MFIDILQVFPRMNIKINSFMNMCTLHVQNKEQECIEIRREEQMKDIAGI